MLGSLPPCLQREHRVVGSYGEAAEDLEALLQDGRQGRFDAIVLLAPLAERERLARVLRALEVLAVRVSVAVPAVGRQNPRLLPLAEPPLSVGQKRVKRLIDLGVTIPLLLLGAPLMALIALAIKLDSRGPVLFRQPRYGFHGNLIEVYKFRTLYHDQSDPWAERLTEPGDPRVTPVGAFLRRASLDELPQLFNVLQGAMSVVGPRPHPVKATAGGCYYHEVIENFGRRYRVRPGITGWAQVNGWRGNTDTKEKLIRRFDHDLYYIENWSPWLDIKIILRTPLASLFGRNAY